VLVASAFWVSSAWEFVPWAVLLLLVVARFESNVGAARTVGIFAAGHVGATLLTAAGIWIAVRADLVEKGIARARDVGPSYGVVAVCAAGVYLLPGKARAGAAVALVVALAVVAGVDPRFTDFGHLLAVLIGLACYPLVVGARMRRVREPALSEAR
jgi:hypothetical protein